MEDIAQLVAGPAGDEDLVRIQLDAAGGVVSGDAFPQEGGAALRHVAVESGLIFLIPDGLMKGFGDRGNEGEGHIPNAHPKQAGTGMGGEIAICLFRDAAEKVGILQISVMYIGFYHGMFLLRFFPALGGGALDNGWRRSRGREFDRDNSACSVQIPFPEMFFLRTPFMSCAFSHAL